MSYKVGQSRGSEKDLTEYRELLFVAYPHLKDVRTHSISRDGQLTVCAVTVAHRTGTVTGEDDAGRSVKPDLYPGIHPGSSLLPPDRPAVYAICRLLASRQGRRARMETETGGERKSES